MKGFTKNIIIGIVGFFFMLSACEICTDYFTNTFGDDYDYYIQPDNSSSTDVSVKIITDFTLPEVPVFNEPTVTELLSISLTKPNDFLLFSPPIYLKNCMLLI